MQKTIKEWLSELPEPYRTKALANYDPNYVPIAGSYLDLATILDGSFDWMDSPEGVDYWIDVYDKIQSGEINPIINLPPPANAISALHAIALKKGFAVEEIESIQYQRGLAGNSWAYCLKDTDYEIIDLTPQKHDN